MKNKTLTFLFIFCLQWFLVCSTEKEIYLNNIDKAIDLYQFDGQFKNLENDYLREEIKELFLRIYEKEKAHPDFIQCLTAQDSLFYAYQVIAKALYQKIYGLPREDFEFLRFPNQNLLKNREEFFLRYPSLIFSPEQIAKLYKISLNQLDQLKIYEIHEEEEYWRILKGEKERFETIDDEDEDIFPDLDDVDPEISRELISVNFTMETYRPLDSALFVFLSGNSVSLSTLSDSEAEYQQKLIQILSELFNSLSFSNEKITACINKLVDHAPRTKLGIINQIFLPKETASRFLYLSWAGGFLHSIYDSEFEENYQEFQVNRKEESFRTLKNFQGRLIAGSLFEDPRIKIIRYTLIPQEAQKQYEAFVQDTIEDLFSHAERN